MLFLLEDPRECAPTYVWAARVASKCNVADGPSRGSMDDLSCLGEYVVTHPRCPFSSHAAHRTFELKRIGGLRRCHRMRCACVVAVRYDEAALLSRVSGRSSWAVARESPKRSSSRSAAGHCLKGGAGPRRVGVGQRCRLALLSGRVWQERDVWPPQLGDGPRISHEEFVRVCSGPQSQRRGRPKEGWCGAKMPPGV